MSWKIDPSHSEVTFSVRHMMISTVRGRFEKFTGTVDFNEADPSLSTIDVQIEAASISTRDPQRDGHLRSPDFLNADAYPYLAFKSKRIELVDAENGRLYGDLTIREITREVVLDVTFNGSVKSPWGATAAGFSASTKINRKDWELTWNVALETGGMLVGDAININVEVEIIKEEDAVPA
jgi:polyisoprenoid-binding protein YceI